MTTKKPWWLRTVSCLPACAIGISLSFVLTACPYESTVPLTRGPSESVDSSLLGYWYGIVKDGSDFFGIEALDITKKSDSVYAITRYGKAIKGDIVLPDTSFFTGFTTMIGDQLFMSVEGYVLNNVVYRTGNKANGRTEVRKDKVYYLSLVERSNDTLRIQTVTENFTARKDLRSPEELKLLLTSMAGQQKNIYDDLYSLSYKKIPRPNR